MKWIWEITTAYQIHLHEEINFEKKKSTEENIWALEGQGDGAMEKTT